jgi:hypothetical protein
MCAPPCCEPDPDMNCVRIAEGEQKKSAQNIHVSVCVCVFG